MWNYKPCLDCGKQLFVEEDDTNQRCLRCYEKHNKTLAENRKRFVKLSRPMKQSLAYIEKFLNNKPTMVQFQDLAKYYGCDYNELIEVFELKHFASQISTEKMIPFDIISRDRRNKKKNLTFIK